jgi:hypothetical protein
MTLPSWERPNFVGGGGDAHVFFVAYGTFTQPPARTEGLEEYRSAGLPAGLQARRLCRAELPTMPFVSGEMANLLRLEEKDLFAAMVAAPECLVVQGEQTEPRDLNYLRDTIGWLAWWFDHGADVVLDVHRLRLYDAASWWLDLFAPLPPRWLNHLLFLSAEEPKGLWLHTRGLRKFGRPDLSIRRVESDQQAAVIEMLQRLAVLQVEGGVIQEGQGIQKSGLPGGMTCHHGGALNDPLFNNVHVEICWPETYSY